MNCLELFAGTGSFRKVAESLGHNVISVDLLKKFNPIHCENILDFDYKQYDKNKFDIIWASPPCQYYSCLQGSRLNRIDKNGIKFTPEVWEERMKNSDKIVAKTLEIINYFKPELWFMENPQTGKLKTRNIVKDLNFYDVDYCKYADWGYRKRTRIWTNKLDWKNKLCCLDCNSLDETGKKHSVTIGCKTSPKPTTLKERYRVPPNLIYSLLLD
mgnify:CR=1 FL=1